MTLGSHPFPIGLMQIITIIIWQMKKEISTGAHPCLLHVVAPKGVIFATPQSLVPLGSLHANAKVDRGISPD